MIVGRVPFECAKGHDELVSNMLSLNYTLPDDLSLEVGVHDNMFREDAPLSHVSCEMCMCIAAAAV